ncbi:MAG: DUF3619 family protein [Rubrivivax sp.]
MTQPMIPDPDWVESRLAARFAELLRESAEAPPPDIAERLRVARGQAVLRAAPRRAAAAPVTLGGGVAAWGRWSVWWPVLGSLLPVAVLAAGVLLLADVRQRDRVSVAAEIDAVLLADDLPPAAYADPGFVAFLKLQQP